ncbi:MAG: LysR family transcriptional regulator [Pseudomonadota bacterium]|nr:LysR family transcriptional regulator [Pseudomonadota bacterium]
MSWDDLRCLLAVHRAGSMSGAARLLQIDQTTIGRRVDVLESRLGTRLLERGAAGCRVTPAGQRACAAAEVMEGAVRTLDRDIAEHELGIVGTVHIGVPGGFLRELSPALVELQSRYPGLRFELSTRTELHDLVRREADIAIRMTPDIPPSLVATRLGGIAWGLYAAESYLQRRGMPASLDGHDIIGYSEPMTRTPGGRWLAQHGGGARVLMHADNVITAVTSAAAGLGLVASPCFIAAREPALRLAWPEAIGQQDFFLVTHQELVRVPRIGATTDYLKVFLRALAPTLGWKGEPERCTA